MSFSKRILSVGTINGEFWIESYDVLQVNRKGVWMDYSTIRDASDARYAVNFLMGVGNTDWENIEGFRIARCYKVVLESKDLL